MYRTHRGRPISRVHDGTINYSSSTFTLAFTLRACRANAYWNSTLLVGAYTGAPELRLRCFSRDVIDGSTSLSDVFVLRSYRVVVHPLRLTRSSFRSPSSRLDHREIQTWNHGALLRDPFIYSHPFDSFGSEKHFTVHLLFAGFVKISVLFGRSLSLPLSFSFSAYR